MRASSHVLAAFENVILVPACTTVTDASPSSATETFLVTECSHRQL